MSHKTIVALVVAVQSLGCVADQSDHPPTLDCSGDNCKTSTVTTSGAGNTGGSSSSGNTATAGTAGEVTLSGQIVEVDAPNFAISGALTALGTFTISVPGASGKTLSATGATSLFAIEGVRSSSSIWLTAKPAAATDLLPGVVALDTVRSREAVVPVLRQSTLSTVGYVLTAPVSLDSSKSQVVLRFVTSAGKSVSGIKAQVSGAENVAYDVGASYSDAVSGTGTRGLAFILNVNAAATPLVTRVTLSGTISGSLDVWVQAGAATFAEVGVSVQ